MEGKGTVFLAYRVCESNGIESLGGKGKGAQSVVFVAIRFNEIIDFRKPRVTSRGFLGEAPLGRSRSASSLYNITTDAKDKRKFDETNNSTTQSSIWQTVASKLMRAAQKKETMLLTTVAMQSMIC